MMRAADGKDGGLRLTGVGLACIGGCGGGVSVIGLLLTEKAGPDTWHPTGAIGFWFVQSGHPKSF